MRSNFSTVAGGMGDRNEFHASEPALQLVSVKPAGTADSCGTRPLGAEAGSGLPEIAYRAGCKVPSRNPKRMAPI